MVWRLWPFADPPPSPPKWYQSTFVGSLYLSFYSFKCSKDRMILRITFASTPLLSGQEFKRNKTLPCGHPLLWSTAHGRPEQAHPWSKTPPPAQRHQRGPSTQRPSYNAHKVTAERCEGILHKVFRQMDRFFKWILRNSGLFFFIQHFIQAYRKYESKPEY